MGKRKRMFAGAIAGLAMVAGGATGIGLVASGAAAVTPTGQEAVTAPASPYTVPAGSTANPQDSSITVTGSGYVVGANVYLIVCDGKAETAPGWDPTIDCDNGTETSATQANASGDIKFMGSNASLRVGVFRGISPQDQFNCLAAGDNPNATTTPSGETVDPAAPSWGSSTVGSSGGGTAGCQIRVTYTPTDFSSSDQDISLVLPFVPVVKTQPANVSVSAPATASFTAVVLATPSATVQWESAPSGSSTFTPISGATSATYATPATSASENGTQFEAVFTNTLGSVTTSPATLAVNSAPVVTTNPSDQSVSAGTTATFTTAATGTPTPSVQWESAPPGSSTFTSISGATSTTYVTPVTTAGESGSRYEAVFSNTAGAATTTAATLTVNSGPVGPTVTTQPTNQSVTAPAAGVFTAAASGSPSPSVQWESAPPGSSTFTPISGATSDTYDTPATTASDTGEQFKALFTNSVSSATTDVATLTVNVAPTITTQPTAQTVTAPATATFSAAATGQPSPTVQWYSEPPGSSTFTAIAGATSATYMTPATAATDNGAQYKAEFTNAGGTTATNAAALTVTAAPAITTQPTSIAVVAGATVSLTAAAAGNPSPTEQWYSAPSGSSTFTLIAGATSGTYTTPAITEGLSGTQYEAVFTNGLGSATTNVATVTVNSPPTVTTQPTPQTAAAGSSATFTAAATGSTGVQWKSAPAGASVYTPISGATSATYTLAHVTASQNGRTYEAEFTNTVGATITTATTTPVALTVTTVPVAITPTSLPGGQEGAPYSQALGATGGTGPYTFTVAPGSALPGGLRLSSAGVITGIPTTTGTAGFTVDVTDVYGDPGSAALSVAIAGQPHSAPYWEAGADGSVYGQGTPAYGSPTHVNAPIVGMASTPNGKGYWLVASDGGVFSFGDAAFYGSEGGHRLNAPIVGIASTPNGKGYWLVASDGGVFSFGDAAFYGSRGGSPLNQPVVGITPTLDGKGYWLVSKDGGIFNYGNATFYGSEGGAHLTGPIVGINVAGLPGIG